MEERYISAEAGKAVRSPLKERVLSAVFWLGITKVLGQMISWVITVYVARLLSPEDYGLMSMSGVFIGFILLFNEIGLGAAIIQKKALTKEDLSSVFWIVLILNTFLYLTAFMAAPLISAFFNEPRLTAIVRVIGINFIISGIGLIPNNMLSRDLTFSRRSVAEFSGNLAGGISTLALAFSGYGVWSLVWGSVMITTVTNIMFCVLYPWAPVMKLSFGRVKSMINFGIKIAVSRFLWYTYTNSDNLIAGRLLGKSALGYYSMAFQFASIPMEKIVSIYTQVAYPTFCEIQNDPERLKKYFKKSVSLIAFITFPLFLMIFLVSEDAVSLFLTPKWAPIVLPLKILCLVSTLRAVNALNIPLVVANGRPGLAMLTNLIFAMVLPIAFYIGSFYGLEGFSYSWLIVFPVLFLIITKMSAGTIGLTLTEYFKGLGHPFFAALFMAALVLMVQRGLLSGLAPFSRLFASSVAGVAAYTAYFLIFKREVFSEALTLIKKRRLQAA